MVICSLFWPALPKFKRSLGVQPRQLHLFQANNDINLSAAMEILKDNDIDYSSSFIAAVTTKCNFTSYAVEQLILRSSILCILLYNTYGTPMLLI